MSSHDSKLQELQRASSPAGAIATDRFQPYCQPDHEGAEPVPKKMLSESPLHITFEQLTGLLETRGKEGKENRMGD